MTTTPLQTDDTVCEYCRTSSAPLTTEELNGRTISMCKECYKIIAQYKKGT